MEYVKRFVRKGIQAGIILICAILIGGGLIAGVYLIPTKHMDQHMKESAEILKKEGVFPALSPYCTSQLDNWTDSTMLLTASYDGKEALMDKAMSVYYKRIEGKNPQEGLVDYYLGENSDIYTSHYPRYWHGYLLFLKPLLYLMNYGMIRIVNAAMQMILNFYLVFLMYRRNKKKYIVPYLIAVIFITPWVIVKSLQFSTVFYIFLIASIALLIFDDKIVKSKNNVRIFFLLIGIVTSYFDFLTYPLVTFGIPFLFFLILKEKEKIGKELLFEVQLLLFWGIGYIGMWGGKWILATIFTEENVIEDALRTLIFRTGATNEQGAHCSLLHVWNVNITAFLKNPIIIVAMIFCIYEIWNIVKRKKIKGLLIRGAVYLLVIILPLIWYIFTRNHSWPHYFFTNKALMISAFGGMSWLVSGLEDKN